MKIKPSYIIFPLIAIGILFLSSFSSYNDMSWYKTLNKPTITPPGWVFSIVWWFIYACTTLSVIIVWNKAKRNARFFWAMALYAINAILNFTWTYFYFGLHWQQWAVWHAGIICIETLILAIVVWPISRPAAWLLAPYVIWTAFATYLSYQFLVLN